MGARTRSGLEYGATTDGTTHPQRCPCRARAGSLVSPLLDVPSTCRSSDGPGARWRGDSPMCRAAKCGSTVARCRTATRYARSARIARCIEQPRAVLAGSRRYRRRRKGDQASGGTSSHPSRTARVETRSDRSVPRAAMRGVDRIRLCSGRTAPDRSVRRAAHAWRRRGCHADCRPTPHPRHSGSGRRAIARYHQAAPGTVSGGWSRGQRVATKGQE